MKCLVFYLRSYTSESSVCVRNYRHRTLHHSAHRKGLFLYGRSAKTCADGNRQPNNADCSILMTTLPPLPRAGRFGLPSWCCATCITFSPTVCIASLLFPAVFLGYSLFRGPRGPRTAPLRSASVLPDSRVPSSPSRAARLYSTSWGVERQHVRETRSMRLFCCRGASPSIHQGVRG